MPKRTNKNIRRKRKTRKRGRINKKYKGGGFRGSEQDELIQEIDKITTLNDRLSTKLREIETAIRNENNSNKKDKLEQFKQNINSEISNFLNRVNEITDQIDNLTPSLADVSIQ